MIENKIWAYINNALVQPESINKVDEVICGVTEIMARILGIAVVIYASVMIIGYICGATDIVYGMAGFIMNLVGSVKESFIPVGNTRIGLLAMCLTRSVITVLNTL